MIRAVLDTNVIVSSLLNTTGVPGRILEAWRAAEFKLLLSEPLLLEMSDVLHRPSILKQLPLSIEQIEKLLKKIADNGMFPETPITVKPIVAKDPSDDVVLATALATGADCIVSGDAHLLSIQHYEGIPIILPRQFLSLLDQNRPR